MKTLLLVITVVLVATTVFAGDCYRNSPVVQMQQDMDAIKQANSPAYRHSLITEYNNKWGTHISQYWDPHELEDSIRRMEEERKTAIRNRDFDNEMLLMEVEDLKDEIRALREALGRTNTE